jgi:hypothetical protein
MTWLLRNGASSINYCSNCLNTCAATQNHAGICLDQITQSMKKVENKNQYVIKITHKVVFKPEHLNRQYFHNEIQTK